MEQRAGAAAPVWRAACDTVEFVTLVREKRRLVRPMLFLYLVVYIGTAALCGFAREFVGRPALGPLNVGFLLILGNYLLAWTLALRYVRLARQRFDPLATAARAALPNTVAPAATVPVLTA